jgi:predicted RNase H-like nuclease (RuvC/YqgF family)
MGPLELFAILVLAGAIVVLLYFYIQEMNRTGNAGFDTFKSSASNMGKGVSDTGKRVSEGISQQYSSSNVEGESRMSGVSERVSGMGEMLRGKVKEVPINTDVFSGRIDEFMHEQSDQLIKDWELATKSDVGTLEKKYSKVARDIDDLERRFNEYRGHANKKFDHIEKRLSALEGEKETETSE